MLYMGIKNELKKLLRYKSFLIVSIILSIIPKSISLVFMFFNRHFGFKFGSAIFSSHDMMMRFVVPFIIIILSLKLFTREQKKGYMVGYLTKPVSRSTIYFSKIIAISIYTIFMIGINFISSSIISMIGEGVLAEDIYRAAFAITLSIIPTITIILFASIISQITKSSIINFLIYYMFFIFMSLLESYKPSLYPLLINSTLSIYKLYMGSNVSIEPVTMNFVSLLGHTALVAGIGGFIFEKKEY